MLCRKGVILGYTLIELLVTVAIAGILLTVAVPNFSAFISNSRERADVQQLMQSLTLARSEAVVRARPVNLTATGGNWAKGWRVWVDLNANASYDSGEGIKIADEIKSNAVITATLSGAKVTSVSFDNQGFIQDSKPVVFAYRSSPEKCSHDRNVNITGSGQVTIADRVCP